MKAWKHTIVPAGVAASVLMAGYAWSQGQTGVVSTMASVRLAEAKYPPVTAEVKADGQARTITLVGRKDDTLIFTESDTGAGVQLALDINLIESVDFVLNYDPADAYLQVRKLNWNSLTR